MNMKGVLLPLFLCLCFYVLSITTAADDEEENHKKEKVKKTSVVYETPKPPGKYNLFESFDNPDKFRSRWVLSTAKKEDTDEEIAKYNGIWEVEHSRTAYLKGDRGLVLKSKAKHHAISVALDKPFHFENDPLVLQYEVNFQNAQECGGAYLKLISHSDDLALESFHDKTPYTIMFGPDKCGTDHKIHFIFRHKNPLNGSYSEKHCKRSEGKLEELFKDKRSHLYTLIIRYDNSYEILVDQVIVNQGSLLEDFTPSVNPPEEIDDPTDRKPDNWDEREKIPDPASKKPDDWDEDAPRQIPDPHAKKPEDWLDDEPEMIADPNAEKPEDWDEEMDGEWEPPLIANPKCEKIGCGEWKPPMIDNPVYKGKWRPPMIANPNYKGKWKPKKIKNPDYYFDKLPFRMTSIGAIGLELWSMSDLILFDNILITADKNVANGIAAKTWSLKRQLEDQDSESLFKRLVSYTNNHPWLWAVYLVVIGLPLVLIIVFCCSSNGEKADQKRVAHIKKTDEVVPDDQPLTTQPTLQQPVRIEEIKSNTNEEKIDDNKLDTEEISVEPLEVIENEVEVEKEKDKDSCEKDDSEEKETNEAADEEDEEIHDGSGDSERSPRKRKPRKE